MLPIVLLAVLVLYFMAKPAPSTAGGATVGMAMAAPPAPARTLGPSTGKVANWVPPTDIVIQQLRQIAPGQNTYGGNEADPRVVGGAWYDPKTQSTCTYDPVAMNTSCVSSGDPCQATSIELAAYQALGICPSSVAPPPPPPPPPASTIIGPPPPPPPETRFGTGHFGSISIF